MSGRDERFEEGPTRPPHGRLEIEQADAPPPIPPSEMPREALRARIDAGDVNSVERALHERNVRVPAVLDELERVLGDGSGNLAAALVTMLIASFRVARADQLAARVLEHQASAGSDELTDLAAALLVQERLSAAERALDVVLAREPGHGRALYLRARIFARRGHAEHAFETIARVSPKLLGPSGMAVQARYALLSGREKALDGALKIARKSDDPDVMNQVREVERIRERRDRAPAPLAARMRSDLRAAMAVEYGSLLLEQALDAADGRRFGMDALTARDAGRLVEAIARAIQTLGLPIIELVYANEDGEVVAAALARVTGKPYREWRIDRPAGEGTWLCMASAATHPHLPSSVVRTLQEALDGGTLRSLALVLPCGWRGPLVPDIVGRVTGDDELPFARDDEVEDALELMFDASEMPSEGLVLEDGPAFHQHLEEARGLLRALEPAPRGGHVPFLDETPVPRG